MSDPKGTIRDALAAAEEIPPPSNDRAAIMDGQPSQFYDERLEDCPLQCLGVGPDRFYFIDSSGFFQEVEVAKLGRIKLLQMVGDSRWLWRRFPSFGKENVQTGWKHNLFSECVIDACVRKGGFDPGGKVRGAGMWRDKAGQSIVHCGDVLYVGRQERKPGVYDGIVYPARAALPRPVFNDYGDTARDLFAHLCTFNWQRGELDARFLMGFIANAFLGGAVQWRPPVWVSGDANSGKSLLQSLLLELFGGAGAFLLQAADASGAGLFQTLHYDCLPVALDEVEPEGDPRKNETIMKLMRLSTQGGVILRGGQDGKATSFTARSNFIFSSILTPPMTAAEKSRLAICELGPVRTKKAMDLSPARMWGRRILGRLIQEYPRYDATFAAYREALLAIGHNSRTADQFGALGTGWDLLTRDAFDPGAPLAWAAGLPLAQLREAQDYRSDAGNCLSRLLTSSPGIFRGGKTETVAYWLREAVKEQLGDAGDVAEGGDPQRVLASLGLRAWIDDRYPEMPMRERLKWICVANSHEGTAKIYEGSHWQTKPGASGVWVQALKRVPDARTGRLWIDGATHRCVMVPWSSAFSDNGPGKLAEMDAELHAGDPYEPGANG